MLESNFDEDEICVTLDYSGESDVYQNSGLGFSRVEENYFKHKSNKTCSTQFSDSLNVFRKHDDSEEEH